MSSPDAEYTGYTTTTKVIAKAGIETQDDVKKRHVNDAIKAADKFIENETLLSWSPVTDAPADIQMASTFLAAAMIVIELGDENKNYAEFINIAMMLLQKYITTSVAALTAKFEFMFVSSGNTTPMNPDADPFISINQPW